MGADAVLDFDAVVKDPADETRVNPVYSFFGGSHFNADGEAALGLTAVTARAAF